jgi:outer membrane protein OmpA-like peptidoglycan-associated protein
MQAKPASFRFKPRTPVRMYLVGLLAAFALLAGCATPPKPQPTLAQRQNETLTRLGFNKTDDGWMLRLPDRISFEFDKDTLKPEFRKTIADFAHDLLAVDIRQLRIEGHTDNVGAAAYNLTLSQRRANIVAAEFVADGFADKDVQRIGLGAEDPAASNDTADGRAKNRRVEIIVAANALAVP